MHFMEIFKYILIQHFSKLECPNIIGVSSNASAYRNPFLRSKESKSEHISLPQDDLEFKGSGHEYSRI